MQALLVLFLLLTTMLSSVVYAQQQKLGIHGEDNREQYNYVQLDSGVLRNVGYLKTQTSVAGGIRSGTCSAFVISADLVLTAAHCLYYPGASLVKAGDVQFWLGYNGGAAPSSAIFKAREVVVHPEWASSGFNTKYDLGLVVLDRRAQVDGAKLASFKELEKALVGVSKLPRLIVAGYPGTRGGKIFFAPSDEYGIANGRMLMHKAAMEQGQSGGPVIWDQKIIGVHSFISQTTNASLAFDDELLALIREWTNRYSRF
ncbi:MAG: trypsin-like serine peptidase [Holosporales bacterium]|jgi:V8-like Glu-specific endopeptidase